MKRVAEIMYIVPEEREAFISGAIHPDEETQKKLWLCGVRNQQYFALNELVFMTFEYVGSCFDEDMKAMAAFLAADGRLIAKRRKDVAPENRQTTNWWAPVKKLGTVLAEAPVIDKEDELSWQEWYHAMVGGSMVSADVDMDMVFDEEDWTENFYI